VWVAIVTLLKSIGPVRTGCANCPPKPETAPLDWQPHPGFGQLVLTRDGQVPREWYEWLDFERREHWWGSWETGEIKAGPRKGQQWHDWIGGVSYFHPDEYVTLGEIEEAVALDPDHDWRLEIHGPMGGAIYQRHGEATWHAVKRLEGFA
jgi:hypothetical protein